MTRTALVLVAAAVVAVLTGRLAVPGALYGWDAYPLIAAARFDSTGAFFGTFAEELMDGRYPEGSFYRPVLHLMLGFEHAVGGLAPGVYGAVDALVAVLAAGAVALAARRLGAHDVAAGLAGAFVLLNPAADHVMWFMPRRPESLAVLFTAGTIAVQRAASDERAPRRALTFALALLACGSKESGVLVALLVVALHACERGLGAALRSSAPVLAAVALFVAVRTAVLGGLGGHPESSLANLSSAPAFCANQLRVVFATLSPVVLAASLAPLVLACVLGAGKAKRRAAVLVPITWLAGNVALSAVSGVERPWYAFQLLAPLALIAASTSALRGPRALIPAAALIALAAPVVRGGAAPDRSAIDASANAFLETFESAVTGARPGQLLRVQGWSPAESDGAMRVFLHAPYSLDAYAELIGAPPTRCAPAEARPTPSASAVTVALQR